MTQKGLRKFCTANLVPFEIIICRPSSAMDLPLELFPERQSKERLRALYAEQVDLSDDALQFWRRMLHTYAKYRGKFHLTSKEVEGYFTLEGKTDKILQWRNHHNLF